MPRTFAQRIGRVKGSGTVKITDAIQKLRREGREIISFSVGEPDFDTPEPARTALKDAVDAGHTHYVSAWGIPALREAIAKKSRDENQIPCEAKHVLVTPAKQAIMYSMLALVDHGDEVLIPDPAWVSYAPLIALAGGTPVHVPATLDTDFRMTPETVAEKVTDKTKLLITNSPSNPTGGVATRADVKGWCDLAQDHDLWVMSDELYEKLIYEGEHVSPAAHPGMFERTVTVNGFSKAYAMTGWRMGWIIGDMPVMNEIIKLQQHSITHPAAYSQHGALRALTMDQAPVGLMREEFRARRDLLVERLRAIPGWECNVPKGAFYVFARFHHHVDSMTMAERLLHDGGVAVTPGIEFGPLGEGHVRISYATSRENIERGTDAMRKVSARLPL